jgi:hypothetical protein
VANANPVHASIVTRDGYRVAGGRQSGVKDRRAYWHERWLRQKQNQPWLEARRERYREYHKHRWETDEAYRQRKTEYVKAWQRRNRRRVAPTH